MGAIHRGEGVAIVDILVPYCVIDFKTCRGLPKNLPTALLTTSRKMSEEVLQELSALFAIEVSGSSG